MKILIDLNKLSNLNCGLGQVALNFGKALAETNTDIELHFLLPKKYVNFFNNKQIYYHTNSDIKKYLKKNKFDLWHSIHQDPDILPNDNTPLLLTIHDLNFLEEKGELKAQKRLKKIQTIVNKAVHISFISQYTKQVCLNNLIINENNTSVIYNGVNCAKPEKYEFNDLINNFFFTIGVLKPKKNFHVLIPLMKHFPDYKLIIAGTKKGSYFRQMQKIAKKENVQNQIVFIGNINEAEKTWLYQNCRAFLFPSLYEGFGLPVIEALKNACPCFISKYTSLPEIGDIYAYYFENFISDDMSKVINNGLKDFSSNTDKKIHQTKYADNFNWTSNSNEYIKLYLKLTDNQ